MNELIPIFLTDKLTFCAHIYNACVAQNMTPAASRRDFIEDCAERYPTTIDETIAFKGQTYRWEFNGDYLTAAKYDVAPSRNFTVSRPFNGTWGTNTSANGQDILKEVTKRQTDKCDKFGGGPGAKLAPAPAGAAGHIREVLLAPALFEAIDLPANTDNDPRLNDLSWQEAGVFGALGLGVVLLGAAAFFAPEALAGTGVAAAESGPLFPWAAAAFGW